MLTDGEVPVSVPAKCADEHNQRDPCPAVLRALWPGREARRKEDILDNARSSPKSPAHISCVCCTGLQGMVVVAAFSKT
jgi:hypothetical protein